MRCPACGWSNPSSYTLCFSCQKPLSDASAVQTPVKGAAKPATGAAQSAVFPSTIVRLTAAGIDLVLMALPAIICLLVAMFSSSDFELSMLMLVLGLASLLLPAVLDSYSAGSLGKRMMAIRVVSQQGGRPGILASLVRHVVKYCAHFVLPVILKFFEGLLFGSRSLHDVLTQTHVIYCAADEAAVARELKVRQGGGWVAALCWGMLGVVGILILVGCLMAVLDVRETADNPKKQAVKTVREDIKAVLPMLENYYVANARFPDSLQTAGIVALPASVRSLTLDAASGALTATVSLPEIQGVRIVLYPVLKTKRGASKIKRWECGSPDVPRADLPYNCNENVAAFAQARK